MTTGIVANGLDLAQIFGSKGASTAAVTGIKVNGTDLNQILLAKADGVAVTTATGINVNGSDLINFFGAPATSLPINGETFTSHPTQAGGVSTAVLQFITNNSTWSVAGSQTNTSGSIPTGATQCKVTLSNIGGSTGASVSNPLSSMTTLTSSNQTVQIQISAPQASPVTSTYSVEIQYANSSGTVISTTNCTFYLNTAAS